MTPLRPLAVLALAAGLVLGLGALTPVHAEDAATRTARRHFQKGEKLFALGRFDDALEQYEQAFEARPLPAFLFNIGQCHRNLGNYDQAIFSFRKYLDQSPDADNRDAVLELIDELEADKQRAEEAARRREAARLGPGGPDDDRKPRGAAGKPIYARWWFWGGVAAVAGASTGAYFLLRDGGVPSTDLGNVVFD
jgi:tetratricopeptide (TPR) repeat protein